MREFTAARQTSEKVPHLNFKFPRRKSIACRRQDGRSIDMQFEVRISNRLRLGRHESKNKRIFSLNLSQLNAPQFTVIVSSIE